MTAVGHAREQNANVTDSGHFAAHVSNAGFAVKAMSCGFAGAQELRRVATLQALKSRSRALSPLVKRADAEI
jgi:hypothetical protein